MSAQEGQFLETKALLAALERDEAKLLSVIADLLPAERQALREACGEVRHSIDQINDREWSERKGKQG